MKTLFQLYLNILQLEVIGSLVTAVHDEGYGLVDTFVSDTHKVMTCDHVCSCCNFSGFAGTDTHFILNLVFVEFPLQLLSVDCQFLRRDLE
jgi:hypothetical protein